MQSIGRYQLVERLGQGGMGVVYRAFDTLLQRVVAVKIIGTTVEGNPELRERFFREARAAGQLSHRNIITIHDLGEHDGQPYLAMEYLEGQDLQRRLAGPDRMGLSHKMDIAIEMCEGLTYAHAHGVVHRDIKPANVFITGNGTVKILDFGLARLVTSELTHSNMMMGTLNYMAPEQVRGERADQRADIFSTGVVVYELLSGKKAFEGDSFAATLYKILQEVPEPLLDIDATLPPQLVVIVERALAKPRDERYQTMNDMLRDLMIFRQQLFFHDSPVTGRPAFISGQAGSKPGSDPRLTPMSPMSPIPLSEMPTISQETPIPTHADADPRAGRGSGSGRVGSGSGTPAAMPSSSTPMPAPAGRRLLPIAVGIGGGVALALAIWIWTQSPGPGTEQTQSAAVRAPAQTSAPATPAPESPAPPAETGAAASPTTPQPQPDVQTSQPPSTRPEQQRTAEPPAARGGRAERPPAPTTQPPAPSQGSRGTRGTRPVPPGSPNAPAADTRSAPAAADPAGRGARSGDPSIPPPTTPPVEAPAPPPPPPPVTVPDRPPASPPSTLPGASQPAPAAAPTPKPTPPPADAAAVPPTTAVRELLGRYEAALESRNLQALKRLWPGLGGREEAALRDEFARASQIEVVIGDPKISVSGASATVEFPRSYQVTVDGQRLRRESRTTMNLRRSGDDWLIEQIRFQPLR